MKPILHSGQATIAQDTVDRLRGIAALLHHDLDRTFLEVPPSRRAEVYERIERYNQQAGEIETELMRYKGTTTCPITASAS